MFCSNIKLSASFNLRKALGRGSTRLVVVKIRTRRNQATTDRYAGGIISDRSSNASTAIDVNGGVGSFSDGVAGEETVGIGVSVLVTVG